MFYFAYGSNMDHHQMMAERCPGVKFIGPAILDEYCIFFDGFSAVWGGAVANIDKASDDEVWGGVFEITEEHLAKLDVFEGYPQYYSRKQVGVKMHGRSWVQAWTYYREAHPTGRPSAKYIHAVIKGAKECGLPEDYIAGAFDHYIQGKN